MPIPVLYIAPWVDYGGTDKATVDWFRSIDRERFSLSLVTTQPSANRRLADLVPLVDELWPLPELMAGKDFPGLILDLIHSRGIRVVHVMNSRLAFDLLPAIASLPNPPAICTSRRTIARASSATSPPATGTWWTRSRS